MPRFGGANIKEITMNNTITFKHEGTGGNCTALIYRNDKTEILLTDGDLSAPKSIESFPISVSFFDDGEYIDGCDVRNKDDLYLAISNILGKEIQSISVGK